MGLKSWLRKMLIDEVTEKPVIKPLMVEIDPQRNELMLAILQGQPFYAIFKVRGEIKTLTTGLTPIEIRTALNAIANELPEMKDILTNVAIDINTATNAKQGENR